MVRRQVGAGPRPLAATVAAALLVALAISLVATAAASAANRRVAIGDYRWSQPDLQLDLGEHVTWYWVGPDTMHSVTGISSSARGLDSDPTTNQPQHPIGDSFQLSFDTPGTYTFQCKLHSSVGGTIEVSSDPGNPHREVDPIPQSNVDLTAPRVNGAELERKRLHKRRGARLRFALDERSVLDADYYRIRHDRKHFEGWAEWNGHIGYNSIRFGSRERHFRAPPGRYVALLRATDEANNASPAKRLHFRIARAGHG